MPVRSYSEYVFVVLAAVTYSDVQADTGNNVLFLCLLTGQSLFCRYQENYLHIPQKSVFIAGWSTTVDAIM